ncbi:MAG: hypothetical protein QOG71_905 [Pyrinomonadaceae bacterium]|nr:hypothetical protein [Pyrinomonadaceae bacterium]
MKRPFSRKSVVLLAVVVVNVVNLLVSMLTNVVSDDVKAMLLRAGLYQHRIPITAGLLLTGLLMAAWVARAEKGEKEDTLPAGNTPEAVKGSREFLADLAERYKKRNAHKLDGRYELSLVVSDDLAGTHTRRFDEELEAEGHAGLAVPYIIERFEREGRLLIVGSPGSGKTVVLLTLAQHLARKAQEDAGQPLPVVFNLDSWSPGYVHFNDWIKAMLTKGYGLSPDFAGQLLTEQRIVFLLDGLDELARNEDAARAAELRSQCLASLEESLHNGSINVVICCRREQFDEMLRRTGAEPPVAAVVEVKDLTPGQIDRALIRASATPRDKFAAPHLLAALGRDDAGVYEQVLSTPFYFTTALQVFDSNKSPQLDAPAKEALEANLITAFVEKKLKFTPNARRFNDARTLVWLTWLAVFLNRRERVTFELSDLQPSDIKHQWRYRLLFSLFCALFGGLIVSLVRGTPKFGIASGILFGLVGIYIITEEFAQWTLKPLRRWRTWIVIFLLGLLACVSATLLLLVVRVRQHGVINGLLMPVDASVKGFLFAFLIGLLAVILSMNIRLMIRGVFGILGRAPLSNIVTEDFAHWTLKPLRRWRTWGDILRSGLGAAVAGYITVGAIVSITMPIFLFIVEGAKFLRGSAIEFAVGILMLIFSPLFFGFVGVPFGLVIGLLLGLFRACRQTARFAKINSPYQRLKAGIVYNVLQLAIVGTLFYYVIVTAGILVDWNASRVSNYSFLSVPDASVFLLFGLPGLFNTPLLKHAVLRVCLTLEGATPLRYADFLSYATELRILEKDGGQWRFRHQILQDYFARRADNGIARI